MRAAGDLAGQQVLEIGPGPGGLTRALLAAGVAEVIAVERDPRCAQALQELAAAAPGRLRLLEADALAVEVGDLTPGQVTSIANLPYNIGTPLLLGWLNELPHIAGMTLMFQREVAERLVATPRTKAYGRLAVMAQWRCAIEIAFHLPARAFVPPPKVASSVVRLRPRPQPLAPAEPRYLERVVATAFNQRRKMLRQSLKGLGPDAEELLAAAAVLPTARAEELKVEDFCRLAEALRERSPRRFRAASGQTRSP